MMLPDWQRVVDTLDGTGDLPPGYFTSMVVYDAGKWRAYIRGPKGATQWIDIKKIPVDAMAHLGF